MYPALFITRATGTLVSTPTDDTDIILTFECTSCGCSNYAAESMLTNVSERKRRTQYTCDIGRPGCGDGTCVARFSEVRSREGRGHSQCPRCGLVLRTHVRIQAAIIRAAILLLPLLRASANSCRELLQSTSSCPLTREGRFAKRKL